MLNTSRKHLTFDLRRIQKHAQLGMVVEQALVAFLIGLAVFQVLVAWRKSHLTLPRLTPAGAAFGEQTARQLSVPALCHALSETGGFWRDCAAPTKIVSAARPGKQALCQLVGVRGFEPPAPSSRS